MLVRLTPRARSILHRAVVCLLALSLVSIAPAPPLAATEAPGRRAGSALPHAEPARHVAASTASDPPLVGLGSVLGAVQNAETDAPLAGVQVVMTGKPEELPKLHVYLPMVLRNARFSALAATAGLAPDDGELTFTATTAADGAFALQAPAGSYVLSFTISDYTVDKRALQVKANQVQRVENVLLHRLDPVVKAIGASGGQVTNSLGNTSLEFPAGALPATEQTRVTYLGNDSLPGAFADGSLPMGFASLEPEGLAFPPGKEVLWTVTYDGPLPVGTDTLCYWWDGKENRWRDPVPGKVVATATGKALQAKVSHFSNYGHAMPGVAGQQVGGGDFVAVPNNGQGTCQTGCPGSDVNVGTGALSESYTFGAVSSAGFPIVLSLRYSSDNDTPRVTAKVPFTITQQMPARAAWRIDFQGQEYTGDGYDARAEWDTRNGLGYRVAPGMYTFKASETFYYDSGQQPVLAVNGAVDVRRGDIWPFGFNWISSYDTLLVNGSATATIVQGDGQYLTYTRRPDYTYTSPAGDASTLVRNSDGTWTRTSRYGGLVRFNAEGRLIEVEDRNGNAHLLTYEPTGAAPVAGKWALQERLVRITDASGRSVSLAYGAGGYVSALTDGVGRVYGLGHDAAGNLTSIADPLGGTTTYRYDATHFLVGHTDATGNDTSLAYDGQGRAVAHTDALGNTRTATYGPGGTTRTDERDNATTYTPNSYGAIAAVDGPAGTTQYTWNGLRQLTGIKPPRTKLSYDARGNVISESTYVHTLTAYGTSYSQPLAYTDAAGNVTAFGYDGRGNLTSVTGPTGSVYQFEYDEHGAPVRAVDPLGAVTRLAYDSRGQVTRLVDPLGHASMFEYNASGNPTGMTDAAGHRASFAYDAGDRLTSATDPLGGTREFAYDSNDNVTQASDPGGHATEFTYDPLDRLTGETDPLGRTTTYAFDAAGNRVGRTNADGAAVQYSYDGANRLVGEQGPDAEQSVYGYDVTNNLTSYADSNVEVTHTYLTGIPGKPDVVETRLTGNAAVHSVVNYDYVELSDVTAAASEATASEAAAGEPGSTTDVSRSAAPAPGPESTAPRLEDLPAYPQAASAVATNACGTIGADTTWTAAGGPYVMNGCSVYVDKGATLTIEPGAIVKFGYKWDMLQVNGRLLAQGTAGQPILFTSLRDDTGGDTNGDGDATKPVPGDWNGIRFGETSTGSSLEHIVVRYGGADGATSALYSYVAPFTMSDSIIAQTKGHGMWLDLVMPSSLTNNRFVDNTLTAGTVNLNDAGPSTTLSGNTATGNGVNGMRVYGTFKGNAVWVGDPGLPFVVLDGNLQIQAGASLSVSPGTIFKLGSYVWDSVIAYGRFVAQGTAAQPITFTSIRDDTVAGDTNNDGDATPPAPGDWNGVVFKDTSSGSVLDHVLVRYGGSYVNTAGVQSNTRDFTLTNSTISLTKGYGLYMDGGVPPTFANNVFADNTLAAVRAHFNFVGASIELAGNTVTGNGVNGFQVGGALNADSSLAGQPDFPFIVASGNLSVLAGARLTLKPGTVVKVEDSFTALIVSGAIDAQGTAGQPVYFTSLKDDTVGGDTNNDGRASRPAPGDWMQIVFNASSLPSALDHTIIRYAGGTGWKLAVRDYTSNLALEGCTIAYTLGGGLGIEAASPTVQATLFLENERGVHAWAGAQPLLRGNRFVGNTEYGVRNDSSGVTIDATESWWGGSGGPLDDADDRASGGSFNPDGDGDKVTNGVKYAPWQVVTGLLYGTTVATGSNPVETVRYGYDALNQVSRMTATGPVNLDYRFGYDAASRLTSVGPAGGGKGVGVALSYDAASRLARLASKAAGVTVGDATYAYDDTGNITSMTDASGATAFSYDANSRLTGVSGNGLSETYAYDPAGNRTAKGSLTYSYDAANELTGSSDGTTYAYDANGNLRTKTTGGQATTYTWDVQSRLVRIDYPDGQYSAYTYDGLGHRLSQRDRTGKTTYYVYDGQNLVQEVDETGAVLANYVYAGLDFPVSMSRGGATYYYVLDHLRSVIGLVNDAGQLVAGYRYDPWGNVIATSGSNPGLANPLRFAGQVWDAESGLYYLRARYYDPALGRFISRDLLHTSLSARNAYAYVDNNPVNATDTQGLWGLDNTRRWVQVGVGVAVGIGAGLFVIGTGGLGGPAVAVGLQAVAAGGLLGGGAGVAIEVATRCKDDATYSKWEAFLAGGFGGLVGGAASLVSLMVPEFAGTLSAQGIKGTVQAGWEVTSTYLHPAWVVEALKGATGTGALKILIPYIGATSPLIGFGLTATGIAMGNVVDWLKSHTVYGMRSRRKLY